MDLPDVAPTLPKRIADDGPTNPNDVGKGIFTDSVPILVNDVGTVCRADAGPMYYFVVGSIHFADSGVLGHKYVEATAKRQV